MRNITKAAIIAFGVTGALAVPASAQSYDDGYYGPQGYAQPYGPQQYGPDPYDQAYAGDDGSCDPYYGCPDDYYDLPVYDGEVYWDGGWYNGPFFYRDYGGHRQFWVHGGWHYGESRGGHFGPALGRDQFRSHGLAARGGFVNRGGYQRGNFAQRNVQAQAFANRGFGGGNGGGWRGGDHYRQQAAQSQPQSGGGGHNWNGGGHNAGGHGGGHHGR